MVGVFRRTLSFPTKPPSKPPISHHIRSISLPSRSHPLISHFQDEVAELKSWGSHPADRTTSWLCSGLALLRDVQDVLDDILQLPQTQESLRRHPRWAEKLLEDFLCFVDAYGIFQTSIMALKDDQVVARRAIRTKDESKLASYLTARKKMAKEMEKLVSSVRSIIETQSPDFAPGRMFVAVGDAEIAAVIGEALEVTRMVSLALFSGIATSCASPKSFWERFKTAREGKKNKEIEGIVEFEQVKAEKMTGLRKKGEGELRMVLKRMRDLDGGIEGIESGSEKVFRSLINTRVSLLNILTL